MESQAGPPDQGPLRASDAERERVAGLLRDAAVEGRITLEDLSERLELAWAARTQPELDGRGGHDGNQREPTRPAARAPVAAHEDGWVGLSSLIGSPGDTGAVIDRNVLGEELEPCGGDPVTGFYRDGCCHTGPEDRGSHTICAVATAEFLEHQRRIGNDLSTPMPEYHFPGLAPGDRWCVTAVNWLRAHEDGAAAYVVLASTHERALEIVPLAALQQHAVDVPGDPSILGD